MHSLENQLENQLILFQKSLLFLEKKWNRNRNENKSNPALYCIQAPTAFPKLLTVQNTSSIPCFDFTSECPCPQKVQLWSEADLVSISLQLSNVECCDSPKQPSKTLISFEVLIFCHVKHHQWRVCIPPPTTRVILISNLFHHRRHWVFSFVLLICVVLQGHYHKHSLFSVTAFIVKGLKAEDVVCKEEVRMVTQIQRNVFFFLLVFCCLSPESCMLDPAPALKWYGHNPSKAITRPHIVFH